MTALPVSDDRTMVDELMENPHECQAIISPETVAQLQAESDAVAGEDLYVTLRTPYGSGFLWRWRDSDQRLHRVQI